MIKYIIESLAVVVADQQHKFNFEPSDYTDAQITNDSIYETLFSYLGKLLNVSFVGQPQHQVIFKIIFFNNDVSLPVNIFVCFIIRNKWSTNRDCWCFKGL